MIRRLLAFWDSITTDSSRGFQLFSVSRQGTSLLVGIILAKSMLATGEIGIYEMWLYLGLFFTFLCIGGALQSFSAIYAKLSEGSGPVFVFQVFSFVMLASFILALLLFFGRDFIFEFLLNVDDIPFYGCALLFLFLHLTASMIPFIYLAKGMSTHFIPYSLLYMGGHVMAILFPLVLGYGLGGMMMGLIIFSLVEHIYLWVLVLSQSKINWESPLFNRFLKMAIPLTLYGGIGVFAQIFDSWLVNWSFSDLSVFAVFKYGARELPGALAIAGAFTTAMIAFPSESITERLDRIKSGSIKLMHVFFPMSIILIWFSPVMFTWIYNEAFYESAFVFNTYLLLMITRWMFPHAILISLDAQHWLVRIAVLELIINVLVSLALVQHMGLVGIAMGTVFAFVFEKAALALLVQKRFKISMSRYVPLRTLVFYAIFLIISYAMVILIYEYNLINE